MTDISWEIKTFEDLAKDTLYEILHLRSKIFVVEQSDIYLDADNKDRDALHIIAKNNDKIVAYSRAFKTSSYYPDAAAFGRVLVTKGYRGSGIGKELISKTIEALHNEKTIRISAQLYLQKFYEDFEFIPLEVPYLEGSIEHIKMELHKG